MVLVIIGHRLSKSTFGAKNKYVLSIKESNFHNLFLSFLKGVVDTLCVRSRQTQGSDVKSLYSDNLIWASI